MLTNTLPRACPPNGLVDTATVPLQKGPVYTCFQCGLPARGLTPWPVNFANPSPLDDWAGHIAYLQLTCTCQGVSRVARLGDWITTLDLHTNLRAFPSWEAFVEANVQAVRQAVAAIVAAVPADALTLDAPTRIVHQVAAGRLAPETAITELHALLKAKA